ncbi:HIT family protein [Arcanobacterium hippocoleae]
MSIFSKIIAGEVPGRFVWEDEVCAAFATIEPAEPGHVLVVPRKEVDKYSDLDPQTFAHLANVSQIIGRAQENAFGVPRAIISILGFDVPHTHIHVIPATAETVAKLGKEQIAAGAALDAAMEKLRTALCKLGYESNVPVSMHKLS